MLSVHGYGGKRPMNSHPLQIFSQYIPGFTTDAFSNIKSHNENILSPWNQFKLTVDSVRPNLATQVSYRNFLYKYSLKIRSFFHNRAFKKMGWKHPDKHNKSKKKFMSFVFLPDNNVNIKVIPVQSFLSAAF